MNPFSIYFRKTKVAGYEDWTRGFKLGKSITINNANNKCNITFYISERGLKKYIGADLNVADIGNTLKHLSEQYSIKFQQLITGILNGLIQAYQGFPSSFHLTKKILFCFDEMYPLASCRNISKNYSIMGVCFNVSRLNESDSLIRRSIQHELLHTVSKIQHNQKDMQENLWKLQKEQEVDILIAKQLVDKGMSKVITYCDGNFKGKKILKDIKYLIKSFYYLYEKRFWNIISDAALGVIVIEIGDIEHINIDMEIDKRNLVALHSHLDQLQQIKARISQGSDFLLATLNLLMFMSCLIGMPVNAVAYSVLAHSNNWGYHHPYSRLERKSISTENIERFHLMINKFCEPQVAQAFLRFYSAFLHTIKAQAIHNDPLNPDIVQQIHNTEAIERSKNAYRILHSEFNGLFKDLRKHEDY